MIPTFNAPSAPPCPITMGRIPSYHTTAPCARCEWWRLYFGLAGHIGGYAS
jgi:hypothetical protein